MFSVLNGQLDQLGTYQDSSQALVCQMTLIGRQGSGSDTDVLLVHKELKRDGRKDRGGGGEEGEEEDERA